MSEALISPHTQQSLLSLVKLLSEARMRADERARVTHERFNVFTTLLSAHDEVRLHTRFLHCLLDPQGTHDCQGLFLELFFATLAEHPPLNEKGDPVVWEPVPMSATWSVQKEASVSEGQIDLLLETAGFGVAIENKIWAAEQTDQLSRYSSYLRRRHGERGRLLYLTLDGKAATSHGGSAYVRISFSQHILHWLEKCLQASYRFIPINQVLLQYREVVRKLTGQTIDSALMNTITDILLQHPDIIRHRQQIWDGVTRAKGVFLDRLAERLLKAVPAGYQARLRSDLGQQSFGQHENGALIITPPATSPLHGAPFEIWMEHIAKWEGLVVGIECKLGKPALTEPDRERLRQMNRLLDAHRSDSGYHKAAPQPLWDGTEWPTGWHNLYHPINDACLAGLIEKPLEQIVADVWEMILTHIKLLERVYAEATTIVPQPETGQTVTAPVAEA